MIAVNFSEALASASAESPGVAVGRLYMLAASSGLQPHGGAAGILLTR